jgi:hypothetical protein
VPRPPTAADLRALSRLKLKWQHLNPYGTFTLNMRERLSLEQLAGPARYFAGISGFGILRPHIMPDSLLQLTLCDRGELPFEELTSILARESVRPRAIFQTHKWFARRLGSAFRALIASTEETNTAEFGGPSIAAMIPQTKSF